MTKLYTDYPFVELGDKPYTIAPIRECKFVAFDGNKYVTVDVEGHRLEVKAGYIYTKAGRNGEVPVFQIKSFCL
jgi:hypothetical protein